jgi:hypothetical protein
LGGARSKPGWESMSDRMGSLTRAVTNSENRAAHGKLNTGGTLYGLAQELTGSFGLERGFNRQLEPGRDKPRFNDPDAGAVKN